MCLQQTAPLILRDGNGAIYPVAKDCLDGIRDPLWFDMAPLCSLSIAVQSMSAAGPQAKNRLAVIALALEVCIMKVQLFSRPYLRNVRAYGTVVCLLSVCHGCIVAKQCKIGLGCY